jgi:hypothetical protein
LAAAQRRKNANDRARDVSFAPLFVPGWELFITLYVGCDMIVDRSLKIVRDATMNHE